MTAIEPGVYRHFKGERYQVIGTAQHSETEEEYDGPRFVRAR